MRVLIVIAVCILALITNTVSGLVVFLGVFVVVPFKRYRKICAFLMAVIDCAIKFFVVIVIAWISVKFGVTFSFLFLVLPLIETLYNDIKRIEKAKRGISGAKAILSVMNDLEGYRQKDDVIIEYCHLIGDLLGFVIGVLYLWH